jgi:hypothetical protein
MNIRWDVTDYGNVQIIYSGFGQPEGLLVTLSGHLERALSLGADITEVDAVLHPVDPVTRTSKVVWTGKVPLQHVADIREFLMSLTVKDLHR